MPVETRQRGDGIGDRYDWRLVEAGPPPDTVMSAVRSHWLTALLPVVVLVVGAAVIGLVRSPEYTAEARLAVGKLDTGDPSVLSSFTDATGTLAETYGRSIKAAAIVRPTAQRLGVKPARIRSGLSAASTPETPVLAVRFVDSAPGFAIDAANIAAQRLERYATRLSVDTAADDKLAAYQKAAAREKDLENRIENFRVVNGSSAIDPDALAQLEAARLVTETAALSYQYAEQGQSGVTDLRVIEPAADASSDRYSVLQILLLVGIAAGAAVGIALALVRSRRLQRWAPDPAQ